MSKTLGRGFDTGRNPDILTISMIMHLVPLCFFFSFEEEDKEVHKLDSSIALRYAFTLTLHSLDIRSN